MTQQAVEKTKEEQMLEWLMNGEVSFPSIMMIYVKYLERTRQEDKSLISELAFISTMYREPKTNAGTKKELEERFKRAIKNSGIFK